MKPSEKLTLAVIISCILASSSDLSVAAEPASQPADPNVIQWRLRSELDDGRRFISDGSLLLESLYLPAVPVPDKAVPSPGVVRLLQSPTDHEFGLTDLDRKAADGHYMAPGGIQLNRKYIECLRDSSLKPTLRFRAKGPNDAVLIFDDQKVVGVMMPMKSSTPPPATTPQRP